jgi:hypothetical protein
MNYGQLPIPRRHPEVAAELAEPPSTLPPPPPGGDDPPGLPPIKVDQVGYTVSPPLLISWGTILLVLTMVSCSAPRLVLEPPAWRADGILVRYEHNIALNGHMAAQWRAGLPIIYWHPDRIHELTPIMLRFTLSHEYCHLVNRGGSEIRADCCGLDLMYGMGLGNDIVLSEIVEAVASWPSSSDHPPGTYRAMALMACAIAIE